MHTFGSTTYRTRNGFASAFATLTLALWQIRHVWRLFLLIMLGMVATVVLICSLPLFSQVTDTASIRNAFTSSNAELDSFVEGDTQRVSSSSFNTATQRLTQGFQSVAGTFFHTAPDSTIQVQNLTVTQNGHVRPSQILQLNSYDFTHINSHVKMLQGRLPRPDSNGLEIALTLDNSLALDAPLGSKMTIYTTPTGSGPPTPVQLTVVGIFQVNSEYEDFWHGTSFDVYYDDQTHITYDYALVSTKDVLSLFDTLANAHPGQPVSFTTNYFWYFPLDVLAVKSTNTADLKQDLTALPADLPTQVNNSPYIGDISITNAGLLNLLQSGLDQTSTSQVSVVMLTILMLGLILFFLTVMTEILVNRQAEAITLTSSRGGSFRQIFVTFVVQSVILGLVTLLVSPFLIIPVVRVLIQTLFTASDLNALNALPTSPWEVALDLRVYLLIAVVIGVVAMSLAVWRTLRNSTLGRSTTDRAALQRPLWQRFYIDLVLAVLGLVVYGFYTYLASTGSLDFQQVVLLSGPSVLVSATLLTLAGVLLFLRLFPLLLRGGVALAARRPGIVPLLSLVVMARAPRQALRTALLLVFTIAFAIFTLVFTATQTQREYDLANYREGADFTGDFSQQDTVPFAQQEATYRNIGGVHSASIGNNSYYTFLHTTINLEVLAADSKTFASSVVWSQQDPAQSPQTLQQLVEQLSGNGNTFTKTRTSAPLPPVPAIVDTATSNLLHLSVGKTFTMLGANGRMLLVDIGEVNHLPTVNDMTPLDADGSAGMLVDYRTFVTAYTRQMHDPNVDLSPDHVWLSVNQDARSITNVRRAVTSGSLQLSLLSDRQAMLTQLQNDPLYLDLLCALTLGAILALFLALLGNISSSWMNVRTRLRSLAVLRSLGTTPSQLATLMSWEQGIIYGTAFVLGTLFGVFFTSMTLSSLVFSGLTQSNSNYGDESNIFLLQSIPPLRIVIPPTLLIALGVLVLLGVIALAITTYTVSRPSLAQTLRLGEDYQEEAPLFVARTNDGTTPDGGPAGATRARRRQRSTRTAPIGGVLMPVRRSLGYLLLTGFGIVISITLACAVPLFSQVAATAGLRDTLAQPQNMYVSAATDYTDHIYASGIAASVQTVTRNLNTTFLKQTKQYFSDQPVITLDTGNVIYNGDYGSPAASAPAPSLYFYGLSDHSLASHIQLLQGQLPQETTNPLQVLLTPEAAAFLHVGVGDMIPAQANSLLSAKVVGIFRPLSLSDPLVPATYVYNSPNGGSYATALVPSESFVTAIDTFGRAHGQYDYIYSSTITWHYRINGEQLSSAQLDDLNATLANLQQNWTQVQQHQLSIANLTIPSFALGEYGDGVRVADIPVVATSILIIGLILLFLGFMAELLVEREASVIAVLRSRGATHRQIFTAFFKKVLVLNVLGLLIGLALTVPVVLLLTHTTLLPYDQRALDIVTAQPLQALLGLYPYALVCVLVTLAAMTLALYQATGADLLALRRETARATRRPLWQRFYLDIVGALVALVAYGFSLYLINAGILDPQVNVQVRSPLTLTATICLILACSLFFLRLFPLLLRLGTALATRNTNVAPMLALAQMARAPRQSLRVALLLIFTTAFVVFVSIFTASQSQHVADVAGYWTGADFSGALPNPITATQVPADQSAYLHVRGVTSAATGVTTSMFDLSTYNSVRVIAVDPTAFLHTVIWPEVATAQQQSQMISELTSNRAYLMKTLPHASASFTQGEPDDAIPAIVDAQTWKALVLTPGKRFVLRSAVPSMTFIAVAEVQHIPTINDSSQSFQFNGDSGAGLLVDYQSFAATYSYLRERGIKEPFGPQRGAPAGPLQTNYVWLRTLNDARSLASVRHALSSGPLQLSALYDRRATVQTLSTDPLNLNLVGILIVGALAPLVLTWIGCLIASWISARQRSTLFGVLRALGSTPRQLVRVLAWEQGIVYGAAVVLGSLFGLLAAIMALPSLVLTSAIPGVYVQQPSGRFAATSDPSNTFDLFSLQNTPPAHTVIPPSVAVVICLLIVLAVAAVVLMTRSASRMMLTQALRVNED